jgi:hypothetical protein
VCSRALTSRSLLLRPLRSARRPGRFPRHRGRRTSRPGAGGGRVGAHADGLPDLRRPRRQPRSPRRRPGRRALLRPAGPAGLAQAVLALRRSRVHQQGVHRAARRPGSAAGAADHTGVLVAAGQLRREHASIAGIARQLGTTWRTVWRSIKPLLEAMAADETRFADVTALGVDEHIWHHVSTKPIDDGGRGPKELTGMVDLSRDQQGRVRARLLDLVPGRSGKPTPTGSPSEVRRSASGLPSPRWTPSTATRTPSTTSSRTPSPSWTPSTS